MASVSKIRVQLLGAPGATAKVFAISGHGSVQANAAALASVSKVRVQLLGTPLSTVDVFALSGHASVQANATALASVSRIRLQLLGEPVPTVDVFALSGHASVQANAEDIASVSRIRVQLLGDSDVDSQPRAPLEAGTMLLLNNWAAQFAVATTYLTNVSSSPVTGHQEHVSLSYRPRRTIRASWLDAEPRRLSSFYKALRDMTGRRTLFPIYSDIVRITSVSGDSLVTWDTDTISFDSDTITLDTSLEVGQFAGNSDKRRFFPNCTVAVFARDVHMEIVESTVAYYYILSSNGTQVDLDTDTLPSLVAAGAYEWFMVPCIYAEIVGAPQWTMHRPDAASVELSVVEVAGATALPGTAIPTGGLLPLDAPEDYSSDTVTATWSRPLDIFEQGRAEIVQARTGRHRVVQPYTILVDREEWWTLLGKFDNRKGNWLPIVAMDHAAVARPLFAVASFLYVYPFHDANFAGLNFDSFRQLALEARFITIVYRNGTRHTNYVVDVVNELAAFRLTLAFFVPGGVILETAMDRVHFSRIAHFEDTFEEEWVSPFNGARVRFTTREAEDISNVTIPEEPLG